MKRKTTILVITYLAAAAIAFGIYAAVLYVREFNYHNTASYGYEHAFEEVVTAVDQLDSALRQGSYATGSAISSSICAEIYGSSLAAEMTMAALPFSTHELEKTAGFLGITGDYAASLLRSCAQSGFTDEERRALAELAEISADLTAELRELRSNIDDGSVLMDDPENVFADNSDNTLLSSVLTEYEGQFPDLPELDYDGKYSAAASIEECSEPISEDEARLAAADFFGLDADGLKIAFSSDNGLRGFESDDGGLSVTVDGFGRVLSLSSSRTVVGDMQDSQLQSIAEHFLADRGFDNMRLISSQRVGDVLTMRFSCVQSGVLCRADEISVSVAGDSGDICTFDATKYYKSHSVRTLTEPAVSEAEAGRALPDGVTVKDAELALVSTDGGNEVLCYEFDCTGRGGEALCIAVDAATGAQYRITLPG